MITISFNSRYSDEAKRELYHTLRKEKYALENECDGYCRRCQYRELCYDLTFTVSWLKEKLGL